MTRGRRAAFAGWRAMALVLGALAIWESATRATAIPTYVLPPPSLVLQKFWATRGLQLEHLRVTAATTLAGLAIAFAVGIPLALVAVYVRPVRVLVLPVLAAFNGIPKVAIAPLFVIWFGLGDAPKVLLAFLMSLFPVFVAAVTGLGEIEPDFLDLSRLSGGTARRIFLKVRLPNAVPYLTDAAKVAFPLALVGALVGEFIGGNRGVGYLILSAQFNLDTPLVFACLLSITLLTSAGTGAVMLIEQRLLAWRPSRRTASADVAA